MKEMIPLILLVVYTVCEYLAYVPQIIKLIKTKSADDLSITSWLVWVVSGACYLAYVLLESPEIGVIYVASMNLIFMIVVCILTAHYQKTKPKPKSKRRKSISSFRGS